MTKISRAQLRQLILKEAGLLNEAPDDVVTIQALSNILDDRLLELEKRIEQIENAVVNMSPSELADDGEGEDARARAGMPSGIFGAAAAAARGAVDRD